MGAWRITKYDPEGRAPAGYFMRDEWSDVGDIGRSFAGATLGLEDYLSVEGKYTATALHFFREAQLDHVIAWDIERYDETNARLEALGLASSRKNWPGEQEMISGSDLEEVCRMVLRGIVWCRLEFTDLFYLHFGYDYYMYVGSQCSSPQSLEFATRSGLFVEEFASPYHRENGWT